MYVEEEMGLQAEEIGWLYSGKCGPSVTAPLAPCLTLLFAPLQCLCCTAYSIFTPVMVFLSGLLIDKIGAKKCAPLFTHACVASRVVRGVARVAFIF